MAIDFQQVRQQIIQLGERSQSREKQKGELRQIARDIFCNISNEHEFLVDRVERIVEKYDRGLRCALPVMSDPMKLEPLNKGTPHFPLSSQITVIAVDGSQIMPDRHQAVEYSLINLGAISMVLGTSDPPMIFVRSELKYDEDLFNETGKISEGLLALSRDLAERTYLAELTDDLPAPVVALTDGPLELWGSQAGVDVLAYQAALKDYTAVLTELREKNVISAGYVDKPAANLVIRLIEASFVPDNELVHIRKTFPLRGVGDIWLFQEILQPGERSAVFAIQSRSAQKDSDELAPHFFYLNIGSTGLPALARVEFPGWIARDRESIDVLHDVLVKQCKVLGTRPYPYLLHRAHETAVVTLKEKEQVTQMILQDLWQRGISTGTVSQKQSIKNLNRKNMYS